MRVKDKIKLMSRGGNNKPPIFNTNSIVLAGDSITAANIGLDFNPTQTSVSNLGYFTWANIFLRQRFKVVKVSGVVGNTISQLKSRLKTDVLDYSPQYCFLTIGINNIRNGDTSDVIIPQLDELYNTLISNQIAPIITTLTPANSTGGVDTPAKKKAWCEVNSWIRKFAQENNVFLVDFAKVLTNPTTSDPIADVMRTDGLHPSAYGGFVMGKEIYNQLNSYIKPIDLFAVSNSDSSVLNQNSMMLGDVNGIATGWSIGGGANTPSKITIRPDGQLGELQRIVTTTTTETSFNSSTISTGFSVGDTVYALVELFIGNVTVPFTNITVYVTASNSSYAYLSARNVLNFESSNSGALNVGNWSGVIRTPNFLLPANSAKLSMSVKITGVGTVDVGKFELRKI